MSKEAIIKSIINNDLDVAKTVIFQALSEKASVAIQDRKQVVASQYFDSKG